MERIRGLAPHTPVWKTGVFLVTPNPQFILTIIVVWNGVSSGTLQLAKVLVLDELKFIGELTIQHLSLVRYHKDISSFVESVDNLHQVVDSRLIE